MVYRVYVEKKPGLAHEAASLLGELKNLLTGIDAKAKKTKAGKEKKAEAPAPMPKIQPAGEDAGKTTAAQQALAVFTDEELQDELGRRGWHGEVRMECVVFIGKKED